MREPWSRDAAWSVALAVMIGGLGALVGLGVPWKIAILTAPLTFFVFRFRCAAESFRVAKGRGWWEREPETLKDLLDEHTLLSVTDRSGCIVDVNSGFCRISGYSREELLGSNHNILNSGHHPPAFWADMWRTISGGDTWRGEICNRRKDGSLYWVSSTIVPTRDQNGEIERYISLRFEVTETKRAYERVAVAQRILEQSGRLARVGGWSVEIETMDLQWSDEVYRIHELDVGMRPSLEEAIQFYAPEARDQISQAVASGIRDGKEWDLELPLITAKGRRLWVRALGTPEFRNGKCVRLYGSFQDITERRSMQARLSLAVGASKIGLWDWDVTDGTTYFSDTYYTMLGYEPGELSMCFQTWQQLCHPEDLKEALAGLDAHFSGRTPSYNVEFRMRRKDGSWQWIQGVGKVVERGPDQEATRMIGLHIDIQRLKEMATRLELAISSGKVAIWDWDIPRRSIVTNDVLFELIGSEPMAGEVPESYFFDRIHPEDAAMVRGSLQSALDTEGSLQDVEFRFRKESGDYTWVRSVGRVIERDAAGGAQRMIGQYTDVNMQRQARLQVEHLNDMLIEETGRANEMASKAASASEAKSEFLANMSHEIRTPLTAILGYTEMLRSQDAGDLDEAGRRDALDTVHRAGEHLLTVINDILDLSKIEAGKLNVMRADTDVVGMLSDLDKLLGPRARGKGVAFRVVLESAIPTVILSDSTRLRQVLMNVTGNAVKFTEGGHVEVRVRVEGERLHFRVVDTGPGISTDDAAKLFQPFAQVDSSHTRTHGGTGLGLTICRRLAEILGGSVSIEDSEVGVGSTFLVDFPLSAVEGCQVVTTLTEGCTRAPESQKLAADLKGRILLAEDGADNQRLISFMLSRAGAEVEVAENGVVALRELERAAEEGRPFDLLLTDMQMPEMDGFTLVSCLREAGAAIPIVALTANAMAEDRDRCLGVGCDDYASKPVDRKHLIDVCARWMKR